jgi:nitroreductase
MIEELIKQNRSTRRFLQDVQVSTDTLKWLVSLARLSPSGANLQPLKYILFNDKGQNDKIFPCLYWAGYLKDWQGPSENERPTAYITILNDTKITKDVGCDHGIAAQSIMLGLVEIGFAGCMIGSIDRKKLRDVLNIPDRYDIKLVLALGKAKEEVVLEDVRADGGIEYSRDENDVHHVPKRKLDEIIVSFE